MTNIDFKASYPAKIMSEPELNGLRYASESPREIIVYIEVGFETESPVMLVAH